MLGVCGVGIPASIQNLLNVTGMTILNNFTSVFGADAVAAMGITQKIYMVPMYVCMGVSQGIMPLVSYNYASGNQKRMKSAIVFAGEISIGFITAAAVFFFLGAEGVVRFFMDNPPIINYGIRFCGDSVSDCRFCVWIFLQSVFSRHSVLGKQRLFLPS